MKVARQGDHDRVDLRPFEDLADPLEGVGTGPLGLLDDPRGSGAMLRLGVADGDDVRALDLQQGPQEGSPARAQADDAQSSGSSRRRALDPSLREGPAGGGRASQEPPAIQADRGHDATRFAGATSISNGSDCQTIQFYTMAREPAIAPRDFRTTPRVLPRALYYPIRDEGFRAGRVG